MADSAAVKAVKALHRGFQKKLDKFNAAIGFSPEDIERKKRERRLAEKKEKDDARLRRQRASGVSSASGRTSTVRRRKPSTDNS